MTAAKTRPVICKRSFISRKVGNRRNYDHLACNFTKTSLVNKWMKKKIPSCSDSALVVCIPKRDHTFKTSANFHKFLTPTPLPSAVF